MRTLNSHNVYERDDFPEDWDDDDLEFFAGFIATEFDAEFVEVLENSGWDYKLYVEPEDADD